MGRLVYLKRGVTVSNRRWQDGTLLKNLWMVVGLVSRYLFERRLARSRMNGITANITGVIFDSWLLGTNRNIEL